MLDHVIVKCKWIYKKTFKKLKRKLLRRTGKKKDTMTDALVQKNLSGSAVWLVGTEDFGNLGDHEIAVAERHFLEKYFPEYQLIEISARNYDAHREEMIKLISAEDIIIGTGGGNFGNQYPDSERIRQDLVRTFPNNKIVIMPQTVWYTQDDRGKEQLREAVELYGSHEKLLLSVREQCSFNFAKEHFRNKIILVPDIVLSDYAAIDEFVREYGRHATGTALVCLRSDLEGKLSQSDRKAIWNIVRKEFQHVKSIDTQKDYLISTERREGELKEFFGELLSADILLTDRLHGMVFAALVGIPCIVFDNYNQKVRGIYEWIKQLPYILFANTVSETESCIQKLHEMTGYCSFEGEHLEKCFAEFARMIREECECVNVKNRGQSSNN